MSHQTDHAALHGAYSGMFIQGGYISPGSITVGYLGTPKPRWEVLADDMDADIREVIHDRLVFEGLESE